MSGRAMSAWIIFILFIIGMVVSSGLMSHYWGRGAHSAMSPEMEAEAANYVNYGRGPHVGA